VLLAEQSLSRENGRLAGLTGVADPPSLTTEDGMTDQEWARWVRHVSDFESSELTQRGFATERWISFSNLPNWLYKLRKESRLAPLPRAGVERGRHHANTARGRSAPVRTTAACWRST
jgi:hypothetical protein